MKENFQHLELDKNVLKSICMAVTGLVLLHPEQTLEDLFCHLPCHTRADTKWYIVLQLHTVCLLNTFNELQFLHLLQMSPIVGERYKCKDCVEKIGFDLCESCYNTPAKIPGRFNQQHKPEHEFEVVQPLTIRDLIFRMSSEQSVDNGSDALVHMGEASHTPTLAAGVKPEQGDGSQEPEDISPSLILSVEVSLDQEDDSDDPSDNISSDLP